MPVSVQSPAAPAVTRLADYTPPDWLVDTVELEFELGEEGTSVRSKLAIRVNPAGGGAGRPLVLDGTQLELLALRLDGRALAPAEYALGEETLTLARVPAAFTLEVETRIHPETNTALEGLYRTGGTFCTQCEARGFRKITYYPDRPDVMAKFTTAIVAERARYPVLLSNGDRIAAEDLPGGRHRVVWRDPYAKPCYLFALVAGDLVRVADTYTTRSGRRVALEVYVAAHNRDQCAHALASLARAMRWDEEVYGLEYDLDTYMIYSADDFNMGAMENKGLNIFNSKYVLARPETATDADYEGIEGVIAHEYFHNWTGNRVTCRDWFQLSLKEGLTVFRDQQYTADRTSQAVKRIGDVRTLRSHQFPEDAGPMAHPVRPDQYLEISNFYTATVYEKGAEVIRMLHTLLGEQGFRRGMDLYFARHDGQAVTCDDFVQAMQDASGVELDLFRRWYAQAGTPELAARGAYDAQARSYTLTFTQRTPPTPGQPDKLPLHIPVRLGLLSRDGIDLPLRLEGEAAAAGTTRVVSVTAAEQSFRFVDVPEPPLPSLLRGFSAPVRLRYEYGDGELAFLAGHDSDPFNRWEAGQQLAVKTMLALIEDQRAGRALAEPEALAAVYARTLADPVLDQRYRALALTLPDTIYLGELVEVIDPDAIHAVRQFVTRALALRLRAAFTAAYEENRDRGPYRNDPESIGRRTLKNLCLGYLTRLGEPGEVARAVEQFDRADNMTDQIAALGCLADLDTPEREPAFARFYERWQGEALVIDKWLALQSRSELPGTLDRVRALLAHPAYDGRNPNRIRAVIGSFCHGNPLRFHAADGAGYAFLREQVLALDARNPQVAARLVSAFNRWKKYDPRRQALMRGELEAIVAREPLSKDVYEIASKALA
jgi:aminopeptidase N